MKKFNELDKIVYSEWLMNKPICEISEKVSMKENDVLDIIYIINNRMKTFEDSISVLEDLGIIKPIKLSKKQ